MTSSRKAFTILELLVVLSVLVILITIIIPRFKGMSDNGKVTQAEKELTSLQAALESYRTFDASHKYPPSTTTLTADYLSVAIPKLVGVLYDPLGVTATSEYGYKCSNNGLYYVVFTKGLPGRSQPQSVSDTGDVSY